MAQPLSEEEKQQQVRSPRRCNEAQTAPTYIMQIVSPCDSPYTLQRKFLLDEQDIARLTRPPLQQQQQQPPLQQQQQQQQLGASAASGL